MKTKTSTLVGLSLLSASVMADTYDNQVDLSYSDLEGDYKTQLMGIHYLNSVDTADTAWNEAAFMGRNSNLSVNYTESNNMGNEKGYGIGFEYYGDSSNNLYASLSYSDTNVEGVKNIKREDAVITGSVGYFFDRNWLAAVSISDEDIDRDGDGKDDDTLVLRTKYVGDLGNGQFFNVEASIDQEETDLTVAGDYYFSPQSSVGLKLSAVEGFDYGLDFKHFVSPNIAVKLAFESADNTAGQSADTTTIGLTGRF